MSTILTCCHHINQSNVEEILDFHFFSDYSLHYFFVGVLVSLHRQNSSLSDHLGFGVARCGHGDLNVEALQQVVAAKWAVDVINAQSGPEDLKIGKESPLIKLHSNIGLNNLGKSGFNVERYLSGKLTLIQTVSLE